MNVERIVIIDHADHELYVEDIDVDLLNEKYNGSEESYINDNYEFNGSYSWDYVTDCYYIGSVSGSTYDLDEKIDELFDEENEEYD